MHSTATPERRAHKAQLVRRDLLVTLVSKARPALRVPRVLKVLQERREQRACRAQRVRKEQLVLLVRPAHQVNQVQKVRKAPQVRWDPRGQ
jgi:hypothetical protein